VAGRFVDTNIFLRHLLQDHPEQSPRSSAFLASVERGEIEVRTSEIVIFEVVFTLQRQYRISKSQIRDVILPLLELPGIVLPSKRRLRRAFDLYVSLNISFADAYHAVLAEQLKLDEIVSFDRDFDRVQTIRRIEP